MFREHLSAVYELIGLPAPSELSQPVHDGVAGAVVYPPDDMLTAQIDGRLSHFYEWAGAGYYDCLKAGGAMHRVEHLISGIHFAFDHNHVYIRLDFHDRNSVVSVEGLKVRVSFFTPDPFVLELSESDRGMLGGEDDYYQFAMDDILELAVMRSRLWPVGFGPIEFTVSVFRDDQMLETWPEAGPIAFNVPERNKEIFWPR
jgi:hypothetical protein